MGRVHTQSLRNSPCPDLPPHFAQCLPLPVCQANEAPPGHRSYLTYLHIPDPSTELAEWQQQELVNSRVAEPGSGRFATCIELSSKLGGVRQQSQLRPGRNPATFHLYWSWKATGRPTVPHSHQAFIIANLTPGQGLRLHACEWVSGNGCRSTNWLPSLWHTTVMNTKQIQGK